MVNIYFGAIMIRQGRYSLSLLGCPYLNLHYYGTSSQENHYTTLGVGKNATKAQIKSAYYNKCKVLHPDVIYGAAAASNADHEAVKQKLNQDQLSISRRFRLVAEAYECLSDPEARRIYDATLPIYSANDWSASRSRVPESRDPEERLRYEERARSSARHSYYERLRNRRRTYESANGKSADNGTSDWSFSKNHISDHVTQQPYPSMWWVARNAAQKMASAQDRERVATPSMNEYSFYYKNPGEAYGHRDYFEEMYRSKERHKQQTQASGADSPTTNSHANHEPYTNHSRARLKIAIQNTILTLVYCFFVCSMTIAIFREQIKEFENERKQTTNQQKTKEP